MNEGCGVVDNFKLPQGCGKVIRDVNGDKLFVYCGEHIVWPDSELLQSWVLQHKEWFGDIYYCRKCERRLIEIGLECINKHSESI